jgi:hypothetical protein
LFSPSSLVSPLYLSSSDGGIILDETTKPKSHRQKLYFENHSQYYLTQILASGVSQNQ